MIDVHKKEIHVIRKIFKTGHTFLTGLSVIIPTSMTISIKSLRYIQKRKLIGKAIILGCLALLFPDTSRADNTHDLGEISVTAKGEQDNIILTPMKMLINLDDFESPGIAHNIGDIVTKFPIFDFRGKTDLVPDNDTIYMRGFSSKRFVTSINGLTIRKTGGRKSSHIVDYALLPVWMFEKIEILPGPHSALYPGKAIGGVLNLIPKTPKKYDTLKPEGNLNISYGSYNTQNNNINISGGVGNFIYDLGYQKYYTDGYLRNTEADIDTFFSRIGYILPSGGHITLNFSYTDADREETVKNDPASLDYDNDYPRVPNTTFEKWQDPTWDKEAISCRLNFRQPTSIGTWSVNTYYSEENRDYSYLNWINRKNHDQGISDDSWETEWRQQGGKIQDEIRFSDNHVTTVGVDLEQCYDGYGRTARWGDTPHSDKKRIEIMSGFAQHQWSIIPRLTLTAGTRYEDVSIWSSNHSSSSGQIYITGRSKWIKRNWGELMPKSFLSYELDDLAPALRDTSISLGVSRIWHAPDYHGDYNPQGRPTGAWLNPEHGTGFDLVFTRRLVKDINLKINYAYYEIKDFIATNSKFARYTPPKNGSYDFQGLEYSDYKINLEKVVQQTVELQIDGHIFDDLSFYIGYAFLDFDSRGDELAGKKECENRAKHRVNAGLQYMLFENTKLLLDYLFQDEQVAQAVRGTHPDEYLEDVPMDAYHLFNFAVHQTLFNKWGFAEKGILKLYVKNFFDRNYMNSDGYEATDCTFGAGLSFKF